jgi:hypothetical protein
MLKEPSSCKYHQNIRRRTSSFRVTMVGRDSGVDVESQAK